MRSDRSAMGGKCHGRFAQEKWRSEWLALLDWCLKALSF